MLFFLSVVFMLFFFTNLQHILLMFFCNNL